MPTIDENISRFEQLLSSVQRDGIDKLMRYIKKNTDFYKAPASTRFHLACEGGLLQHSLNVYDCLTAKRENPIEDQLPLGHGEKSVMLIQCYIRLSMQEVMAIRWHMGFSEAKENWNALGSAMEKYPIILSIHEADLEASKILEANS